MKFLKYIIALVAAAGLMTACQTDLDIVEAMPADAATKPVFHQPEIDEVIVTTLNQSSRTLYFDWEPAYFGANAQVNYALVAYYEGNQTDVIAGITDTEVTITFEILNTAVALPVADGGLGLIANVKQNVEFRISASIGNGTIYSDESYSFPVSPIAADKSYPVVYAIGDFVGWDFGTVTAQSAYLYNFAEDDKVYEGVLNLNGKAQNGFKISGALKWDDTCNWGTDGEAEAPAAEAASVQLICSGASGNLGCYSKSFYHFSFDKSTLVLTKNFGFDVLKMNDKEMAFNAYKRRFWVDVENLSGTIEFSADEGAFKWGAGEVEGQLAQDGAAITVAETGNYRVYAYLSELENPYYELSSVMYGMDEPAPASGGGQNPDQATTWSIYGDLNAEAEGLELSELINGGGENHMLYLDLSADLQFCLVDAQGTYWRTENDTTVEVGEPIELVSNGNMAAKLNLTAAAGSYHVTLSVKDNKPVLTFNNLPEVKSNLWGIVGSYNGWGGKADYYMEPVEGNENLFVAKNFIADSGESYKVRYNNDWAQNYGVGVNDALRANVWTRLGNNNFSVAAAGTYDIYLDLYENYLYVMEAGKSIEKAAEFEALIPSEYIWDIDLVRGEKTNEMAAEFIEGGKWLVAKSCLLNAGETFRMHAYQKNDDGSIKVEYFYTVKHAETETVTLNAGESAVVKRDGSAALEVAETGAYDIYFDLAKQALWLMATGETPEGVTPAPDQIFSVCGTMTEWESDLNMEEIEVEGVSYWALKDVALKDKDAFKVRYAASWNTNFGLTYKNNVIEPNTWMPVKLSGEDIVFALPAEEGVEPANEVADEGEEEMTYDIYFNLDGRKVYVMEKDKLPSEATAGTVTIPTACKLYIHSTDNWEEMYLYGWELEGYDFGAWPGIKLDPAKKETVNEVEYWVHEFPETVDGKTAGGFVFSAGQDKPQTEDVKSVKLDRDRYFTIEAQVGSEKCKVTEVGGDENDGFQGEDTTWALAGIYAWDDATLFQTTETEGLYVVEKVTIASDFAEFKVKVVGTWDNSVSSNISGIKMNSWVEASTSVSGNTSVAKAGLYDIYYDSVNSRIYVMAMGTDISQATQQTESEKPSDDALLKLDWYVAGTMNDWKDNADYKLTADFDDNCLYIDLALTTSDEFKIKSSKWYGYNDGALSAGNTYKLVDGGNMKVSANGNYQLRWYPATEELKVVAK